jgi:beta-galactosidase
MGIHRDVIPEGANLEGYKLLFTPFIPYLSADYIARAKEFVEKGGIWIVGPLTGGRTEHHTVHTDRALGELEKLAGVEVLYTYPIDGTGTIGRAFDTTAPLGLWSSVFEADSKSAVGTIEEGLSKGNSFLTEHPLGAGKIVMLGSMPLGESGDLLLKKLVDHYSKESHLTMRSDVSNGTIVAPRQGDGYTVWVIINMDGNGGSVTIPKTGVDMQKKRIVESGTLELGRFEYKVIQFKEEL